MKLTKIVVSAIVLVGTGLYGYAVYAYNTNLNSESNQGQPDKPLVAPIETTPTTVDAPSVQPVEPISGTSAPVKQIDVDPYKYAVPLNAGGTYETPKVEVKDWESPKPYYGSSPEVKWQDNGDNCHIAAFYCDRL